MYLVDRIVSRVKQFIHSDTMYNDEPVNPEIIDQVQSMDEFESDSNRRLQKLDDSLGYLLSLLQAPVISDSSSTSLIKVVETSKNRPATVKIPTADRPISISITANPEKVPFATLSYLKILQTQGFSVAIQSHIHCNVTRQMQEIYDKMESLSLGPTDPEPKIIIRFIWKMLPIDCQLYSNATSTLIYGEASILQFLLAQFDPINGQNDAEWIQSIAIGLTKEPQNFVASLNLDPYFTNIKRESLSVIDCFVLSCVRKLDLTGTLPGLKHWTKFCGKFKNQIPWLF